METCQMSNVCCALCNVVVKTPDDPLTRRPHPWCGTIWSSGHFVSGSFYNFIEHRTTDIRHLTSLGLSAFFHSSIDRPYSWALPPYLGMEVLGPEVEPR